MKKRINLIFIVIFASMISLPYLFAHRDAQGRNSSMENRRLAAYPSLRDESGKLNTDYLADFETWLDDNLRGRTVMMDVNATLQYKLFQRIVKSDTLCGKNHWLFVRDDEMISEYQHLNLLSDAELTAYASHMQQLADAMNSRGIAFYYFQCYSKEAIYPEQYADGINQFGTITKADQIVSTLYDKTSVRQIDVKDTLLAHRDDMVYFRYTDLLHWNERGSYFGYTVLMDTLKQDFPQLHEMTKTDYDITEQEASTDLYGYTYPYTETIPLYRIRDPKAREITETPESLARWNFLRYQEHTHEFVNTSCDNDMKILILGDSFVRMFLKDDIAESFASTLSIDWLNLTILEEVVDEYQPDIVILESAESALPDTIELVNQIEAVESP